MSTHSHEPQKFLVPAADGYPLDASAWIGQSETFFAKRPVVIINPATSVHSRYYCHFANYLYANGFDVVTYDYRDIGNSRPNTMRGFDASWIDWGTQDFEGILRFVATRFRGQPIHVVAHSVGGLGSSPSHVCWPWSL